MLRLGLSYSTRARDTLTGPRGRIPCSFNSNNCADRLGSDPYYYLATANSLSVSKRAEITAMVDQDQATQPLPGWVANVQGGSSSDLTLFRALAIWEGRPVPSVPREG